MGKHDRVKREALKRKCLAYLGGKVCSECGVDFLPHRCYDFHHTKGVKESTISKMLSGSFKWSAMTLELDKCIVVCSNCHRLIHGT